MSNQILQPLTSEECLKIAKAFIADGYSQDEKPEDIVAEMRFSNKVTLPHWFDPAKPPVSFSVIIGDGCDYLIHGVFMETSGVCNLDVMEICDKSTIIASLNSLPS